MLTAAEARQLAEEQISVDYINDRLDNILRIVQSYALKGATSTTISKTHFTKDFQGYYHSQLYHEIIARVCDELHKLGYRTSCSIVEHYVTVYW